MKVAVVGNGNVGMAVFQALFTMREINEIALVGRNIKKIQAEVKDYQDYRTLRTEFHSKLCGGGYELTKGADIIVYTAGAPRQPDQSRLDLVKANVQVARDIFGEINKYNRDAFIIVVSNPVDIITTVIREVTERPASKVIGTGTLLDSARLRRIASEFLEVSPESVILNVVGEHGNTSCVLWSTFNVAGMPLDDFLRITWDDGIDINKEKLHRVITEAGGRLIKGKGYTAYGVAAAVCRIASAIINDIRELMPVSTVLCGQYDISDLAISVPCIVGRDGAEPLEIRMTDEELAEFKLSAGTLREVYESL